ncbi:lysosomal acid lipase/cholesteryl ester hydrolase-like [Patiria miniata]|uniref:Partial AB-hydrolase lipase domain-containing protein n=1 Tax=Patiria miniata TaxID=46514 RepID=A0A914AMA2_PATMI|nr:lysosomal acid lipase/cholesteryl ester hydrolase-like [Patiria miniata]
MARFSVLCSVLVFLALFSRGDAWLEWLWSWNSSEAPDPDVMRNASELITSKGYPCERHFVTTADGFILGLQRIPHGRNETGVHSSTAQAINATEPSTNTTKRPVVFLQHGLLCSSTNWLTNLANQSFAYILADAGFDVWLGNVRGNVYSMGNTHLSSDSNEFWDWSWDQMAEYDLPAMVDLALEVSGQDQLYYVGHSQGSLMAFAGLSKNKELEKKIKMFFALGPVATVGHMTSPLRYLSTFLPEIEFLLNILGVRDFLPSSKITEWLAADLCTGADVWCENIVFVLCGFDRSNLNEVFVLLNCWSVCLSRCVTFFVLILSINSLIYSATNSAYRSAIAEAFSFLNLAHHCKSQTEQVSRKAREQKESLAIGPNEAAADAAKEQIELSAIGPKDASQQLVHVQIELSPIGQRNAPQDVAQDQTCPKDAAQELVHVQIEVSPIRPNDAAQNLVQDQIGSKDEAQELEGIDLSAIEPKDAAQEPAQDGS